MIKLNPNDRLLNLASVLDNVIANYQPPGRLLGVLKENPPVEESDLMEAMKKGDVVVATDLFAYYIENKNDHELRAAAQKVFPKSELISVSGKFHYPQNGYMGWHSNSNMIGYRMYATRVDEDNKSFFRYYENGKVITEWEKKGWNFRAFKVSNEKLYWHCVKSETNRYSFGFRFKTS